MKKNYCMFLTLLFLTFCFTSAYSDESTDLQQKREKFALACAGIYEYQYLTGGFDATLLMYKREMMGQLVYNNTNSPHYEDKDYFDQQVKLAYSDLVSLPDKQKEQYQHEQWILKPALCDEIVATVFILVSAMEWSEGGNKELLLAKAILRDIYPWNNEAFDEMQKDIENQHLYAMKNREPAEQ